MSRSLVPCLGPPQTSPVGMTRWLDLCLPANRCLCSSNKGRVGGGGMRAQREKGGGPKASPSWRHRDSIPQELELLGTSHVLGSEQT